MNFRKPYSVLNVNPKPQALNPEPRASQYFNVQCLFFFGPPFAGGQAREDVEAWSRRGGVILSRGAAVKYMRGVTVRATTRFLEFRGPKP